MYRHKGTNDKWSDWSPTLKISYKINVDLENKKIVFTNNDEKTIYIIKTENFSLDNTVRFMVLDSKALLWVVQIVSFKDSDEKILQLLSKDLERIYTVNLL